MAGSGPYLQLAVLCEQVIKAENGQVTLVNILDSVTNTQTGPDVPDQMPPFSVRVKALISLRAGSALGRFAVKVRPEDPSGRHREPAEIPVQFSGDPAANAVILLDPLQLDFTEEGLHWIDVFLVRGTDQSDELLTRVPLSVQYRPQKIPSSG